MQAASTIVSLAYLWLAVGAVTAAVFLTIGIDRVDEDAQDAYVFRPLLIPGILLLWPLVLWRWWQIEAKSAPWLSRYRPVRQSYPLAIIAMSVAILVAVALGLSERRAWPADIAPEQLSAADPGEAQE